MIIYIHPPLTRGHIKLFLCFFISWRNIAGQIPSTLISTPIFIYTICPSRFGAKTHDLVSPMYQCEYSGQADYDMQESRANLRAEPYGLTYREFPPDTDFRSKSTEVEQRIILHYALMCQCPGTIFMVFGSPISHSVRCRSLPNFQNGTRHHHGLVGIVSAPKK